MAEEQSIPEATLEIAEPDGGRRQVQITESPFLIGRGAEGGNHLHLADKRISRRAAAVVYEEDGFRLEDRGQRNGVFVNGKKVESSPLQEGDAITLGTADSFQLIFHSGPVRDTLPKILSRLEEAAALDPGARALRPLGLLLEATALLQSHLPLEELMGAMVDRALAITDADRGLLLEVDPQGGWRPLTARLRGGRRAPPNSVVPSQTALNQASQKRRSVVEEDVAQAPDSLRIATSVVEQQLRSVIALPLQSLAAVRASDQTALSTPGTLLGVLYLDSRRPAAFSRLERQILDALAREAASVLDNARLLQKEQEQRRMEQELAIARNIQQVLLPRDFTQFSQVQITGVNRSCLEVGGDYFDVMEVGPHGTAFLIADVCGKGLGAALLTTMLQGTFSAIALWQELARICTHINGFICTHSEMERYATLFVGVLDPSGRLEYINAGHPSPLLVQAGKVEAPFPAGCLPLGLVPEAEFNTSSVTLAPGDTLVLYTDGITEATNPEEAMFGADRLREVVAQNANAPVKELQASILAEVDDFSRDAYQADDITLLIVRYPEKGPAGKA
ncbi:MAG TPA: SpoIIE family protein phosphatase [Candidatus Acidoferrales bacterium]|nr:SpoIIE family protein phosphatase [Candidatus Acidoferrales bacterium]